MSNEVLATILFGFIAFAWIVYLSQETFFSGTGLFTYILPRNHAERKQLQIAAGLHFDGNLVWFVAAESLIFGVFPLAYATQFTYLYIIMFLLLFAIIGRGTSVELIYKIEDEAWITFNNILWLVSSIMLLFIFGTYMTHTFYGYPLDANGISATILNLFKVPTIAGGLMFVVLGFVSGAAWIKLTCEGDIGDRALAFVKKLGLHIMVPVLLLLIFMGINNSDASIFAGELYGNYPVLFILPLLTVLSGIMVIYYGAKQKGKQVFIHAVGVVVLFIITGFVGIYPGVLHSSIDYEYAITITDAMSGSNSLIIILIAVSVILPIVIGYQTWKHKHFNEKIKLNDE